MTEPCSIREAARRLSCSRATLQRLIHAEPSLARAVVGRGARGSTLLDLCILEPAAWRKLACTGTEDGLSDQQRLDAARRRRVWFDLQGWLTELEQLESGLVDAADYRAAHIKCISVIRVAAAAWAERVAAELPEVPVGEAETWIERTVHDALTACSGNRRGSSGAARSAGRSATDHTVGLGPARATRSPGVGTAICWGWSRGHRRGSVGSPSICCQRPAVLMPRGCASIGRWPSCAGLMLWSRFGSKP